MCGIGLNIQAINFCITLLICSCVCIIVRLQHTNRICRICYKLRIAAVFAGNIAPAVLGAGGLNFNRELVIDVLESGFDLVIGRLAVLACKLLGLDLLAAVGAVAHGQAELAAADLLYLDNLARVMAALKQPAVLLELLNCNLGYLAAAITDRSHNAGNLSLGIQFRYGDGLSIRMLAFIFRSKDGGSGQQGRDHENGHQHTDKSLFHVSS